MFPSAPGGLSLFKTGREHLHQVPLCSSGVEPGNASKDYSVSPARKSWALSVSAHQHPQNIPGIIFHTHITAGVHQKLKNRHPPLTINITINISTLIEGGGERHQLFVYFFVKCDIFIRRTEMLSHWFVFILSYSSRTF